jgi:hypothetical protein
MRNLQVVVVVDCVLPLLLKAGGVRLSHNSFEQKAPTMMVVGC